MRKSIKDLWTILIVSIRDLMEPVHRILAIVVFLFVISLLIILVLSTIFGFVENLFEIIGNTITSTVIGEPYDVIE